MRCRSAAFNLHASLLPRWRGAAPINRAIMAGDAETGVMVMRMEEGLDTGPVAMAERVAIGARRDRRRPARRAGAARRRPDGARARRASSAARSRSRRSRPRASPMRPRSTRPRPASTGRSPWRQVHDHVRGLSPFPGAWFEIAAEGKPVRVKVLRTTRGEGPAPPGALLDGHADGRVRGGRGAHPRTAARRPAADEGGGIPARHAAAALARGSV